MVMVMVTVNFFDCISYASFLVPVGDDYLGAFFDEFLIRIYSGTTNLVAL